jgi:hypothetical protein
MNWMLSFALRVAVAFVLLTAFQVVALSFPERSFEIGALAGIVLQVFGPYTARKQRRKAEGRG